MNGSNTYPSSTSKKKARGSRYIAEYKYHIFPVVTYLRAAKIEVVPLDELQRVTASANTNSLSLIIMDG